MNSYKNARIVSMGRKLLIAIIKAMGLMPAAAAAGTNLRTARKWLQRYKTGESGFLDRSSRPHKARSTIDEELSAQIERLRRAHMPMCTIAQVVGRSVATVSRVLAALRLSSLKALEPVQPIMRYERSVPGEMLHMDTKKLSRTCGPATA